MPVSRMRMRPWLEFQIDSNKIEGLTWVDKEKRMFSIPWKHAARHGWQVEKDASLFKEWAIHTGKFKPGVTESDPKTWKANFRCAMNSLPDIKEVKDQSVNKGCGAVRVYQMLPEVTKRKVKRSRSGEGRRRSKDSPKVKSEDSQASDTSYEEDPQTQEDTIDSTDDIEIPLPTFLDQGHVPEYSTSVEIGPDSTNTWTSSFQVSPDHEPGYDDHELAMITRQLEHDQSQWYDNGRGFLSNEVGTTTSESNHSPQSQWSDTSDEVELQLVTELMSEWSTQEFFTPWSSTTMYSTIARPIC